MKQNTDSRNLTSEEDLGEILIPPSYSIITNAQESARLIEQELNKLQTILEPYVEIRSTFCLIRSAVNQVVTGQIKSLDTLVAFQVIELEKMIDAAHHRLGTQTGYSHVVDQYEKLTKVKESFPILEKIISELVVFGPSTAAD